MTVKQKIIAAIIAIGIALIAIFQGGFYSRPANPELGIEQVDPNEINIISTNPSPLESDTYVLPNQTIEFTFNQPLENRGEFKVTIIPETKVEIQLSDDRKTAKIIPQEPYKLNEEHTIMIKSDSKFDGKKTLNKEIIYHFRTITYSGV